ncbi:MAG TPA: hypothetical protein VEK80_17210 [Kribbellaceae bacterium]|nr:hypothetical protein [Kribbellaceae bacterium]
MTTLTARVLLYGGSGGSDTSAELVGTVIEAIELPGQVRQQVEAVRADARAKVANALDGMLGIDVGEALLTAWSTYGDLLRVARRTAADSTLLKTVPLVAHEAGTTYHPRVEVLVNDVPQGTVNFELSLTFAVDAARLDLTRGAVVAVRSGSCVATAELACEGTPVARPRSSELNLPGVVRLNRPFVLVAPQPG